VTTNDGADHHVPACEGQTGEVRVGVRPEKITLVPAGEPAPDGCNVLRGTIVVAAFLGISIQYVIKAAGGEELNVFAQNTNGSEPHALAVGREVQLAWRPEHTFVVERG
jgi:spermidine/putrescine transport system ATP-binding protein